MRPAGTRTTGTRTCQGHLGTPCTTGEPPRTNPPAPRPPRGCAALLPRATKGGDKKPPASPQSHPNRVPPPRCHHRRSPPCRARHRAPHQHQFRPLVPLVPRDTHVVTPAPVGTLRPGGLRCAAGAQPKLQQAFFSVFCPFFGYFFFSLQSPSWKRSQPGPPVPSSRVRGSCPLPSAVPTGVPPAPGWWLGATEGTGKLRQGLPRRGVKDIGVVKRGEPQTQPQPFGAREFRRPWPARPPRPPPAPQPPGALGSPRHPSPCAMGIFSLGGLPPPKIPRSQPRGDTVGPRRG